MEVLTHTGWRALSPKLPININLHCQSMINSTATLKTGGFQDGIVWKSTYIISNDNPVWTPGPSLSSARYFHSCCRILTNKSLQSFGVIVIGGIGISQDKLITVEYLDQWITAWVPGPQLPRGIFSHTLHEEPSGGVILVGGLTQMGMPQFKD